MRSPWLRWLGVALGVTLFSYLLHQLGWPTIRDAFLRLGWLGLLILLYPALWHGLNSLAWLVILNPHAQVSFSQVFEAQIVGEGFNSLLPSGYVGGEPLKVKFLSPETPTDEAVSSVLVAKAAQSVAMIPFLGLGLWVGQSSSYSPIPHAFWFALGVLGIGTFLFTLLLGVGVVGRLVNKLSKIPGFHWMNRYQEGLRALDESLGEFYRCHRARYAATLGIYFVSWLFQGFEPTLIGWLLHQTIGWRQAWFMTSLAQLGSLVAFAIPAGLGVYEGAHQLAAQWLGLRGNVGLLIGMLRRIRQAVWDGAAILLLSVTHR